MRATERAEGDARLKPTTGPVGTRASKRVRYVLAHFQKLFVVADAAALVANARHK